MLLKRLTIVLFALVMTACSFNVPDVAESIKTGLELDQASRPLRTQIAKTLAPTPTISTLPPIIAYFSLASSPTCVMIEDDDVSTFRSIECLEEDTIVTFDEWLLENSAIDFLNILSDSPNNQVITDGNWSDETNPDVILGRFLQYKDKNGEAVINWTVSGKRLSGWAFRADGDQEALYQWWSDTGSSHN